MTPRVRPVESDGDREALVAILNEATPEFPTSLDELRWADATYPGGARFVADVDGRVAGAASTGRIWMQAPEYERYWLTIGVLPDARGRGLGSRLYEAASEVAARDGKIGFQGDIVESRPEALAFFEHRGFHVYERMQALRLRVPGIAPRVAAPPGITITTLADDPAAVAGVHAVAKAAFLDIPHVDEPMRVGTLDEFRARDVDRPGIPADGFFVARAQDGSVVGYASLLYAAGSTTTAYHDMTAVLSAWRGRGIAAALKRATIAWATENGLEWLETGNDEGNAAMRAVNERLGYEPTPVLLGLRGPLAGAAGQGAAG